MTKKPFDNIQYSVLQDRIWKYNDLLWKNFLGYGGSLAVLAGMALQLKPDSIFPIWVIQVVGSLLLLAMANVQRCLLSALDRHVREAKEMEEEKGWRVITWTRDNVRESGHGSVQDAYWLVVVGMFFIPLVVLLLVVCPCITKLCG